MSFSDWFLEPDNLVEHLANKTAGEVTKTGGNGYPQLL